MASGKHSDTEAECCREVEEIPPAATKICKNKDRRSKKQADLEAEFGSRLLELFDVAHAACDQLIRIARDVVFLQDQRSKRKMFMTEEKKPFKVKENKRAKRKYNKMKRRESASKAFDETDPAIDSLIEPSHDEQSDSDGTLDVDVDISISKYDQKTII